MKSIFQISFVLFSTGIWMLMFMAIVNASDNLDGKNDSISSKFFHACVNGDTDDVAAFLDEDPDLVNSLSKDGESCLMLAAVPDSMDLVQLLMRRGGDINERASGETNHRMPVLGWHIIAGNHDIIDLLILYGADVNQQFDGVDEEGEMVGIFQSLDLVDFLLNQVEIKEEEDRSVRDREKLKEMKMKYELTREILIAHGARLFIGFDEL